jgi:hypothetical protein
MSNFTINETNRGFEVVPNDGSPSIRMPTLEIAQLAVEAFESGLVTQQKAQVWREAMAQHKRDRHAALEAARENNRVPR